MAQGGDFFVSHFTPTLNQEEQTYFDILFTPTDEMVAANRAGIVSYDGNEWRLIRTPSAPLSIDLDSAGNLYVGCADDFGKISIVEGQLRFVSLADENTRGLTLKTLIHKNKVYYLQGYALHEYDLTSETLKTHYLENGDADFVNMLILDGQLRAETSAQSYALQDSLIAADYLLPDETAVLTYSRNAKTGDIIFAGMGGKVYNYNGSFDEIDALNELSINDISWVSERLFVVSTLSDGMYFYDIVSNQMIGRLDSDNGLLDNEIFAIATDGSNGVWIANTFGFTRVAPLLPIRSFNHYPGLEGNLTTAAYIDNTWNIATSSGVYYFDQVDKYKNVVYYVPKATTKPVNNTPVTKTTPAAVDTKKKQEDSKPILGGLFKKRKKDDDEPSLKAGDSESEEKKKPVFAKLKTSINKVFQKDENEGGLISRIKHLVGAENKYERKIRKELVSTQYLYKQIPDLTDKVKQLIPFGNSIIAVTPSGIMQVTEQTAEEIFNEPVRYVYHPEGTKTLWIGTTNGTVIRLDEVGKVWMEYQELNTTGDVILSIYQDRKGVYWMAGANQLFKVIQTDTAAYIEDSYPLQNQFFDNIRISEINDQLYLVNNLGIFTMDTVQNILVKDTEMMEKTGQVKRHLIQSDGRVWVHNGNNWMRIEPDGQLSKFTYLKLFPEMTYIEQVEEEFWLINDHQSLFKFSPKPNDSIPASHMYFREISDPAGLLHLNKDEISISYEENSVTVEMARPDYLNLMNIEYQYRLAGLNDEWSEWSSDSRLEFNYLPPGKYVLEVRSKDAFGRIQESDRITFRIKPPYWQTAWFSALQVLFFTGLVFIASRLNRKQTVSRKQLILSNLLTIVTIVMVIELLQTIAESFFGDLGSPVLAFGLDVIVALLIFPVETLLRWVVTGRGKIDIKAFE